MFIKSSVAALDNKYRHSTLIRNAHGSVIVSALGFQRSGPEFDSRRSWSDFSSTHQNRRIISSTPTVTSTAGNYNHHGQTYIYHLFSRIHQIQYSQEWKIKQILPYIKITELIRIYRQKPYSPWERKIIKLKNYLDIICLRRSRIHIMQPLTKIQNKIKAARI